MKKGLAIICVMGVLVALLMGIFSVSAGGASTERMLISSQKLDQSSSTFQIFVDKNSKYLNLQTRSYNGKVSTTLLLSPEGKALFWDEAQNYENRFMIVYSTKIDNSGYSYQTLVDTETRVMYKVYLQGDSDVEVMLCADGLPMLWEGEILP